MAGGWAVMEIEEVRRLTLQPGDILVIKVPVTDWRPETMAEIDRRVSELVPDHKVVVAPANWEFWTIREEASGAKSPDDRSPTGS